MRKIVFLCALVAIAGFTMFHVRAEGAAPKQTGKTKFQKQCAVCHPDGGNIINPNKTLHKKNLMANNIKTEADIIRKMRNPGPGMTTFDEKTLPDSDAHAIAAYILKTF